MSEMTEKYGLTPGCSPWAEELKKAREEQEKEPPMPKTTTTDKLMRPGSGEVEQ